MEDKNDTMPSVEAVADAWPWARAITGEGVVMSDPLVSPEGQDQLIDDVVEEMTEGCVVPFLGAGVNCCGRPTGLSWTPESPYLPLGAELSEYLAKVASYPAVHKGEEKNLLRVAQYLSTKKGYGSLRDQLHRILVQSYQPTAVHRFLARLPKVLQEKKYGEGISGFKLLAVTTNYDDLLEQAFRDEGVEFDLLVYRAEKVRGWFWHIKPNGQTVRVDRPNEYEDINLDTRPVIVKIHGAVDRANRADDSYVITEDDYIDYLAGADLSNFLPVFVKQELVQSHFLFLGYSLQDWNLRVFLKKIWDDQQKYDYKSWAIQLDVQEIERELWRSRGVELMAVSLEDYIAKLENRLANLPGGP